MVKFLPKAIDLFAGCGGLTQGLRQAGFRVIGAVEINEIAAQTYRLNHPDITVWESDIKATRSKDILEILGLQKGELDLLAGCPPCQGFSSLRTLNGSRKITDSRNDLIYQFIRLVRSLRPKTVMMENVPGLSKDSRFNDFLNELESLKFKVNWDILDASEFGVPQRRKRLMVLASRLGILEFARTAKVQKTVRDAIGALPLPGESGDELHDLPEHREPHVRSLIEKIPIDGGSRTHLPENQQLACHRRCNGFKDVYGRLSWDSVASTITTGCFNPSKGRFLHPAQHRNITMREAALLQTFPKRYQFPIQAGKIRIAELIGNALPPEFIRRHARKIFTHLFQGEKQYARG